MGLGSNYIRCSYRDRSIQSGTGGGGIIGFRLNGVFCGGGSISNFVWYVRASSRNGHTQGSHIRIG